MERARNPYARQSRLEGVASERRYRLWASRCSSGLKKASARASSRNCAAYCGLLTKLDTDFGGCRREFGIKSDAGLLFLRPSSRSLSSVSSEDRRRWSVRALAAARQREGSDHAAGHRRSRAKAGRVTPT